MGGLHVAFRAASAAAKASDAAKAAERHGEAEAEAGLSNDKESEAETKHATKKLLRMQQRFFRAWAQNWCQLSDDTPTTAKLGLVFSAERDSMPARVRVNAALAQFPPFAAAFNCPSGSPMYPSSSYCHLW